MAVTNYTDLANTLELVPGNTFFRGGTNIQNCSTTYKNVHINWRTVFPYNIFKDPSDYVTVDLILPMSTEVKNGYMADYYYTAEGYGLPEFKTLEHALEFIDNYKLQN